MSSIPSTHRSIHGLSALRSAWHHVVRLEVTVMLLGILIIGGIWLFAEVANEVIEGDTQAFDTAVVLALRSPTDLGDPIGPFWLEEIGRDLTALGGVAILTILSMGVVIYLILQNRIRAATLIIVAVIGGLLLGVLLKNIFGRPRPE